MTKQTRGLFSDELMKQLNKNGMYKGEEKIGNKWFRRIKTIFYSAKDDRSILVEKLIEFNKKMYKKKKYFLAKQPSQRKACKLLENRFDKDGLFRLIKSIKNNGSEELNMYSFRMPIDVSEELNIFDSEIPKNVLSKTGFIIVAIKEKLESMKKQKYGKLKAVRKWQN